MNPTERYLSLLKGCLTRSLFLDEQGREVRLTGWRARVWAAFQRGRTGGGGQLAHRQASPSESKEAC